MKVEKRGAGRPLVYLHPAGNVRWTPVLEKLAETHEVHVTGVPGFDAIGNYIEREIGKPCDVLGCSFSAALALWLALERTRLVDHLVLVSPAGLAPGLVSRLSELGHTVLILHGTEDRSVQAESVRLLKSRLPRAFLVYVWAAGHDIEVDQPARMAALVQSFLERSDAFVVPYA
jgi:pimeloyl-ACP methyl ester carboxylesterase